MQVKITVEIEDGDPMADPDHQMGISNEAWERLTGVEQPLSWLGEVTDVEKV